ncbi:hypothetical protein CC1G_14092 [Coprinopsis cinerea okayama7|uniref:Uncharacterized protein n=1 Tax=Coprinopsis cinerea (strain Okayama-7 / 130 / ATCC MYA-4618 / FGSC 9003) TaxID=240176 RepID=D6RLB0_COPC7|nr:hypothetical protein CC1G_14092 [Coprinopsis cinerea okayama7\|eukprot:XP_002911560.1 hypothetical protein CC1G_14092 [Coprinopsis cinerea okayama7\
MSRQPYHGSTRALVIAFDVGTTFSGVSYSVLDPGAVPEIRTVTRFPSQDQVGGDSKIPTIVYYDREDKVVAVGAEAVREGIQGVAEEGGWVKAEWFKLHLRPAQMAAGLADQESQLPCLPPNKTAVQIFADFLRYLRDCTKQYIQETEANGESLWESLEGSIHYVITHPNGWEGYQQSQLRSSAVLAGLIPESEEGNSRVSFVTEGEASLHFCVLNGLAETVTTDGNAILIVDAGGGTIDLSAYRHVAEKQEFEETIAPQCYFQGSVFVTTRAQEHLKSLLEGSKFADDVEHIVQRFDKRTKLAFRDDTQVQFIQFGSVRENDPSLDIRSGQLKLKGSTVAEFFEPSISCIQAAIGKACTESQHPISTVILVGGFAASDWLYMKLEERLKEKGLKLWRPDRHVNKAVSDGGVSFYLDNLVKARVSKAMYGVTCYVTYNPKNPEHEQRKDKIEVHETTGETILWDAFDTILPKNQRVTETQEFRRGYSFIFKTQEEKVELKEEIIRYDGTLDKPLWIEKDSSDFVNVCSVVAEVVAPEYKKQVNPSTSEPYWELDIDIVVLFGLTELKAQVCWKENGIEQRSPATIIFHEQ